MTLQYYVDATQWYEVAGESSPEWLVARLQLELICTRANGWPSLPEWTRKGPVVGLVQSNVSVVAVGEDEYNAGVAIRRSHIQESET